MAGPGSLHVAARLRCDNNAVACRCDRVAPPPVVQTAGHCTPRHLPAPRQQPRQQRRRVSPATATVPATPPPAGRPLPAARPRWCRLGCVLHAAVHPCGRPASHDAAARPPRRSLVVACSHRHRARTRRQHHTSPARSSVPRQRRHYTASPRTPVRAALSALQRARRRSPAVTSSTVVGNTAKHCRPPTSQPRRPRRCATASATSLRVAVRPRRRVGCATARPRRLAGATSITSLRLAATPTPRQRRHRTSSHAPPRWSRENSAPPRRRHNFYSYYTPFQSARQPSEIDNSPTHIF